VEGNFKIIKDINAIINSTGYNQPDIDYCQLQIPASREIQRGIWRPIFRGKYPNERAYDICCKTILLTIPINDFVNVEIKVHESYLERV